MLYIVALDESTDPDKGAHPYGREDSKSLLPCTYLMLDDGLIGSDLPFLRLEPRPLTAMLPQER